MNDSNDKKIIALEQQLQKLVRQVTELNQRVSFLERENNRRKQDVNILAQRKG
jgi:regulator of replication initiation timing